MQRRSTSYAEVLFLRWCFTGAMAFAVLTRLEAAQTDHSQTHVHEWTWMDALHDGELLATMLHRLGVDTVPVVEPGREVLVVRRDARSDFGVISCFWPPPPPPPPPVP